MHPSESWSLISRTLLAYGISPSLHYTVPPKAPGNVYKKEETHPRVGLKLRRGDEKKLLTPESMYICADYPPGISVHFERDEIFVLSLSPHSAAAAFWQGNAGESRRNLWSGEGRREAAASRCQKGPRTKIAFPAVHKLRIPRKGFLFP